MRARGDVGKLAMNRAHPIIHGDAEDQIMKANPRRNTTTSISKQPNGFSVGKFLATLVVVLAILAALIAFSLPTTRVARPAARRSQCKNNLKQIALALHHYEADYHALPPAYTVDENGKPLHSWRTLLLPYLDQKTLYDKIDLTKAWDDPVNVAAYKSNAFSMYRCLAADVPENHTTYLAIVTPNSCFRSTEPRLLSEITDKFGETLTVIEVDSEHAVHWMAPKDADETLVLALGPKSKHTHTGGIHAAFVDGTVRFLNANLPSEKRRALISITGNEQLNDEF